MNVWFSEGQLNSPAVLGGARSYVWGWQGVQDASAGINGGLRCLTLQRVSSMLPVEAEEQGGGKCQCWAYVLTANRPLAKAGSRMRGAASHVTECGDR